MISHFFTAPFFLHPLLPDEGPDGAESYDFVQGVSLVDQQGGCALHLVFLRQFRMLFGEDFRKGGAVFFQFSNGHFAVGAGMGPEQDPSFVPSGAGHLSGFGGSGLHGGFSGTPAVQPALLLSSDGTGPGRRLSGP